MPSLLADPQSASDIVAFSIGLIALTQAGVWYREREPGMLWFAAGSLLSTLMVVAGDAVSQPGVAPSARSLLVMVAVRCLFAFGLTAYFRISSRTRAAAIAALVLPAAVIAWAILADGGGSRLPVVLPLLWADFGMALLCVAGARREPGAGHGVLALAPLIGPAAVLLDPWRGPGPHLNHDFPGAAIGFGIVVLVVSLMRKSRDSRAAQAHAQKMSNYYAALSHTNQAIARIKEPEALYDEICRICVQWGHAAMACVYLRDGHLARRVASAGEAARFLDGFPDPWDMSTPQARASHTVRAMTEGLRLVSNDYQNDLRSGPWHERARRNGVHSLAWLPLRRDSEVVAVLMLAASEPRFFNDTLMNLLEEMAHDVSFALDNLDREARHLESTREVAAGLDRFSRLFQTAPVAAAIVSLDDRCVLDANDAFCERYRATRAEMIGRPTSTLSYSAVHEDRERFYETMRREGRVRNLVLKMIDAQGNAHAELTNAEPIDYLGRACHLVMNLDITELRAAEDARQALAHAEAVNRAKTKFLSSMSHELRTPLNAVLGFSGLLRHEAADRLTAQQLAQLDHVQQAGWHLLRLINDVLDLSRIEAGQFGVNARALEVAPLLDEALQMSAPLAAQAGVALQPACRDEAPTWALADPTRLRQVLLNVISNAIKYNRPGGSVQVHAGARGEHAVIEVHDTGLGMNAQQLEHLFEPFNRLGRDRQGIEGTGIGLSLTRQLMQLMSGDVAVRSEEGRGTWVTLTLPRVEAEALPAFDASPPVASAFDPATPAPLPAPRGTVLYIEDNAVNTLLVEQLLARWDEVTFVAAGDGATGLRMAQALRPDLVLLDLQLPDLDGFEVLARLRALGATRQAPVVVLSASAMAEDIAQARRRGATDYWTKPLDFQRFLAGIAELMPRGAPADAVPAGSRNDVRGP